MNDPAFREVLDRLAELRAVTPPQASGMESIRLARQALTARRRRRIVRVALVACTSAAAVVATAIMLRDPPVESSPAPLVQLKHAVEASNDFRGVVQIKLEQVQLDAQGQAQRPSLIAEAELNTGDWTYAHGTGLTPEQYQSLINSVKGRVAQSQNTGARTILIPVTWEARTTLIPINPEQGMIEPYAVGPDQVVTLLRKDRLQQFQIQPTIVKGGQPDRQATVWVDPATGLVDQVQLRSRRDESVQVSKLRYLYSNPVEANPFASIPATAPAAP